MTLAVSCAASGQTIRSWKDTGTPWPPIREIVFGEGEMFGVFDCLRCGAAVPVHRKWIRFSREHFPWSYGEHPAAPHS